MTTSLWTVENKVAIIQGPFNKESYNEDVHEILKTLKLENKKLYVYSFVSSNESIPRFIKSKIIDGINYIFIPANSQNSSEEYVFETTKITSIIEKAILVFRPSLFVLFDDNPLITLLISTLKKFNIPSHKFATKEFSINSKNYAAFVSLLENTKLHKVFDNKPIALINNSPKESTEFNSKNTYDANDNGLGIKSLVKNDLSDRAFLKLSDDPVWISFALEDYDYAQISFIVNFENIKENATKKALALIDFLDEKGESIYTSHKGFKKSEKFGYFFQYLSTTNGRYEDVLHINPPKDTKKIRIGFVKFFTQINEFVHISNSLFFKIHDNKIKANPSPLIIQSLPFESSSEATYSKPIVASILDPFSHACFANEFKLIDIKPKSWRIELLHENIDFLLVESAWHGNDDAWLYRVANYNKPAGNELSEIIKWAKKYSIPTIFWNKEDPPNFDRFIDKAIEFDYIFTTDENCIARYKARAKTVKNIAALPFAAQPIIHNPHLKEKRLNAINFAGTYYADDFESRRKVMDVLLRAAAKYDLDIFDRMFNVEGDQKARFKFPDDLEPYVRGCLNYNDMLDAYRRYRVALNVNSVSDSPTMFSRRVFELMACGTPVVSTASLGINKIFPELVPTIESDIEARNEIDNLMNNGQNWLRKSVRGIRAVYSSHTYAHRAQEILTTIGSNSKILIHLDLVAVIYTGGQSNDFFKDFSQQTIKPVKTIIIESTDDSESAKKYSEKLTALGFACLVVPEFNLISYVHDQHSSAILAICNSENYYGPNYLLDARNSILPGLHNEASTIHPIENIDRYFADQSFDFASEVGKQVDSFFIGSLVISSKNLSLDTLLKNSRGKGYAKALFNLRSRPWFEFIPNAYRSGITNLSRICI